MSNAVVWKIPRRYFEIAASGFLYDSLWDWAQMNFLSMRRFSNCSFMIFIWFMVGSWSDEWVSSSMALPLNFTIRWKYSCSCTNIYLCSCGKCQENCRRPPLSKLFDLRSTSISPLYLKGKHPSAEKVSFILRHLLKFWWWWEKIILC